MYCTREPAFTMSCRTDGDQAPLLTGVDASGQLDGLMFTLTLRQTWRNTGPRKLELVYSFPLPAQAVLLGFSAEFDDRRLA